jgi:hypothetical protein
MLDQARTWHAALSKEQRRSVDGRLLLGTLLYRGDQWGEADDVWTSLVSDSLPLAVEVRVEGRLGAAAAREGDTDRAEQLARHLATLGNPELNGSGTLARARIAALLGNETEAVDLLRRAFSEGVAYGIWIHRDVDLEPLRDDPAYQELVRPKG